MIEIEINKQNLENFLLNIRKSDKEELIYFFGKNYKDKFIDIVLKNINSTSMLSYMGIPSCIGGTYKDVLGTQVWLLCSNKFDKKFLFKYLLKKVNELKKENRILYNYIFKSNFKAVKWLSKLGFKFSDTPDNNVKFFILEGD